MNGYFQEGKEGDKGSGSLKTDGESVFINYTDPQGQSIEHGDDGVGFLAAETEHARQFEDGELGFEKTSGPGGSFWRPDDTYDAIDERKSHMFGATVSGGDKTVLNRRYGAIGRSIKTLKGYGIYDTPIQNWEKAGRPRDGVNHAPSATGKSETVRDGYNFYRKPSQ